jgi:rRNA maturation endonuclease Nob1
VAVRLSRVSSSSFKGLNVEEVREWVAQCHGMTLAFPHNTRTASGMAAQCGFVEQRRDVISRRCQTTGVVGIRL